MRVRVGLGPTLPLIRSRVSSISRTEPLRWPLLLSMAAAKVGSRHSSAARDRPGLG